MKKYEFVSDISLYNKEKLAKELREIIKDGWGDFGVRYVKDHVLTSKFVTLALEGKKIVGFASAREIIYEKRPIYYLEFTAVRKNNQGDKLSKILNRKIFQGIIKSRLKRFKTSFEILTITPNPRVLGTIARTARYVYPNPYKPNYISQSKDKLIKDLVNNKDVIPEKISLKLNHYVIQGFYYDCPELIYDPNRVPTDKEHAINTFAKEKLDYKSKKGKEFVIYARYHITNFLQKI